MATTTSTNIREQLRALALRKSGRGEVDLGYNFGADCAVAEAQPVYVETVRVWGIGPITTSYASSNSLDTGVNYELRASGIYTFASSWAPQGIADAKCNYRDAAHTGGTAGWVANPIWAGVVVFPVNPISWVAVGTPDGSGCDTVGHAYTAAISGAGTTISFVIRDDAYGDNSGYIDVEIWH